MANEINLPLYQADMSQVFDKYIGETEKNIDAIFTEAEKQNCILFLDEADSLCGKRSEINDSKDKYSNNDTAFLLQRIESYDGIVILATNYINNIDNAFMRRMKYVVPFSIPDKNIRLEIWKSSFTEQVSIDDDVDFEYLAEQFEFSGSNIKNIVLASVFLSASEKVPVNMKHIITSIYNECQKQQRHLFSNDVGKYENLFNEINLY
jgi:SpoVK/Ycf46/Vps4 family AAA+-type ATPase